MAPKASVSTAKRSVWRVIQQTGDRKGRKVFEGLEADAREYVRDHFPRPHVDEFTADANNPVHDVKLVSPSGSEEVFHSKDGWQAKPDYNANSDDELVSEE